MASININMSYSSTWIWINYVGDLAVGLDWIIRNWFYLLISKCDEITKIIIFGFMIEIYKIQKL